MKYFTVTAVPLLGLAGCAVPVVAPPPLPPAVSAAPAPAAAPAGAWAWTAPMDTAAARLRSALGGGADVSQTTDQRLWVSLPGSETFAAGRSALKPRAGAWLDQVALALREMPRAEVRIVGRPDATGGTTALALDRAASARDWMVMRGVPAYRFAVSALGPKDRSSGGPPDGRLDIVIGERAGTPAR